jgi:membrane-bound metal-dependent hydrolase YbcI (DUF457 family)
MTTPTHIIMGAVLAKAALTGGKIEADPSIMYAVAILFSNIPDIDIPLFGLKKSSEFKFNHRLESFLHFPFFWVLLFGLFYVLMPNALWSKALPYYPIAFIACCLHFLMDTIGIHNGICWFGPFHKKEISFTKLIERPSRKSLFVLTYCLSPGFRIEMLLWIGSVWYLFIRPI